MAEAAQGFKVLINNVKISEAASKPIFKLLFSSLSTVSAQDNLSHRVSVCTVWSSDFEQVYSRREDEIECFWWLNKNVFDDCTTGKLRESTGALRLFKLCQPRSWSLKPIQFPSWPNIRSTLTYFSSYCLNLVISDETFNPSSSIFFNPLAGGTLNEVAQKSNENKSLYSERFQTRDLDSTKKKIFSLIFMAILFFYTFKCLCRFMLRILFHFTARSFLLAILSTFPENINPL